MLAFIVIVVQFCLPVIPAFADENADDGGPTTVHESSSESLNTSSDASSKDDSISSHEVSSTDVDEVSENTDQSLPSMPSGSLPDGENKEPSPMPPEENPHDDGGDNSAPSSDDPNILTDTELLPTDGSSDPNTDTEVEVLYDEGGALVPSDPLETYEETSKDIPFVEDIVDIPYEEEPTPTSTQDTPLETETPLTYHVEVQDDNSYTFGRDECARVADGSFYCTEAKATTSLFEDRVFAGPDRDGDSEIFVEFDGVVSQVTHNSTDDAAPFYDEISHTLVWHRLIDARYQIMSLDLDTHEEKQLTYDNFNNMQPTRHGRMTVWQGWVGNDWEIFTYDGETFSMITDNSVHDIGPSLNGDFIVWQSEEVDGWKVRVFNMSTKQTSTIDDAGGASIENPRLMLVYDAKHENGDIETRGYDLITGKKVPLNATSSRVPEKIPEPDQTGEKRALITSTQLKVKVDEEEEGTTTPPVTNDEIDGDGTPSTDDSDLVIPPLDDEQFFATSTDPLLLSPDDLDSGEEGVTDISTLVVDTYVPQDISPEHTIPDLVIPPFDEEYLTNDSQGNIAE